MAYLGAMVSVIWLVILVVLAGCQPRGDPARPAVRPAATQTEAGTVQTGQSAPAARPPATQAALGTAGTVQPPPAAQTQAAQVVRVIDGDTIVVDVEGRQRTVRYIGVNTPESVTPGRPVECFGKEASARNEELVTGKQIRLEKDVSETDRFGRALRYVWIGDDLVNARLVAEGYAQAATFPPDVHYADLLRRLEAEAREAKRGMWGVCDTRERKKRTLPEQHANHPGG